MDYINVTYHDDLAEYLDQPFDFMEGALYHWNNDVLKETRGYHRRNEKTKIKENISFILNDNYVELSNSFLDEDPNIELLDDFSGKAKTLSFSCKFKIPEIKIKGQISILNIFKPDIKSDYTLTIKNIEISSVVGLYINGDGYNEDYFKHKLNQPSVLLTYLADGKKLISLTDIITNQITKSRLENYIVENSLKEVYSAIEYGLLEPMYDKALVSNTVGLDYALRDLYRIHEKKMKAAFNIFVDKVVEITNGLMKNDSPIIPLNKIFKISKNNGEDRAIVLKGVLNNMNCLKKTKTPIILVDNDCILLYIPVDFENLQIKYQDKDAENEVVFITLDTHFELSLKKLNTTNAEINLLDCKVKELKQSSNLEFQLILDLEVLFLIQEKLQKYLELALRNEELNILAINPPNVEITYDRDDFMGQDSDEDEKSDDY